MESSFRKNLASSGSSITLKEIIDRIQESENDIKNKKIFTLNEAREKVKTWK